jgi:hypothetical protein
MKRMRAAAIAAKPGIRYALTVAGAAGVLALAACGGQGATSQQPAASQPTVSASAPSSARTMTNFIGKGLQTAQDDAQAQGFYNLASHDASGRARHQILDRDWKVCFQAPAAGTTASSDSTIDFGVVKLDESCPATDQGTQSPPAASEGQTMPNLIGKSLNVAITALPSSTSVTPQDTSGQDRMILVQSNWQVCTQQPKPGAQFNGQPVTFGVVKFDESCP